MAKRKSISKRTRFEVFKRDGFVCQYCGRTPPVVILEVDHIIPVDNMGTNDEGNLLTACFDCNRGKAASPLQQVPQAIAEQIQDRRDRAAQVKEYNAFLLELREQEDDAIKRLGLSWFNHLYTEKDCYVFGQDRIASIRRFLKNLPEAAILDAIDIAFSRVPLSRHDERTWKYFCGICWNKIKNKTNG